MNDGASGITRGGEKLSPNTGRRWADHRHNDAVLPCETRKGFGARWTWVQILSQPLSGV